jgi:hypothetical protein
MIDSGKGMDGAESAEAGIMNQTIYFHFFGEFIS